MCFAPIWPLTDITTPVCAEVGKDILLNDGVFPGIHPIRLLTSHPMSSTRLTHWHASRIFAIAGKHGGDEFIGYTTRREVSGIRSGQIKSSLLQEAKVAGEDSTS